MSNKGLGDGAEGPLKGVTVSIKDLGDGAEGPLNGVTVSIMGRGDGAEGPLKGVTVSMEFRGDGHQDRLWLLHLLSMTFIFFIAVTWQGSGWILRLISSSNLSSYH